MRAAFPRISHVVNGPISGGGVGRDDLIFDKSDEAAFFQPPPLTAMPPTSAPSLAALAAIPAHGHFLVVEEKIDGANVGFSLNAEGALQAQNRSHVVHSGSHSQFRQLDEFLGQFGPELCNLFDTLAREQGGAPQDYVLFGEWCIAQHSVYYDGLPEAFVIFDLARVVPSGRSGQDELAFFSTDVRDAYAAQCCPSLPIVPKLIEQRVPVPSASTAPAATAPPPSSGSTPASAKSWEELHKVWMTKDLSEFGSASMEGVVVRLEVRSATSAATVPLWGALRKRGKCVRDDFKAGIEEGGHWMGKEMVKNVVLHYDRRQLQ